MGWPWAWSNSFKKVPSPPLIMLYAVFQGVMLGGVSQWYAAFAAGNGWNDIVLQAVVATMTTFGVMLALYVTGVIKVTKKFQSVMLVAMVSYLVLGIGSFIWAMSAGETAGASTAPDSAPSSPSSVSSSPPSSCCSTSRPSARASSWARRSASRGAWRSASS